MHLDDGDGHDARQLPDPVYSMWVGPNPEFDTRDAPLRLHVARRAGHRPRLRPGDRRDDGREGAAGPRRLRPDARTRRRALWADRRRRHAGADLGRAPARRRARRQRARAARTATARTSTRAIPTFRASRLSLLDRGFVFAIAHVRGGGEMGREWYEDGRLEHKANTFTDFIACAEHLVAQRLHVAGAARRARRQRGRAAHGRGREPAPRSVRGDRRRGAVRRRRHDDARSRRSRSRSPSGRSGATRASPTRTRA